MTAFPPGAGKAGDERPTALICEISGQHVSRSVKHSPQRVASAVPRGAPSCREQATTVPTSPWVCQQRRPQSLFGVRRPSDSLHLMHGKRALISYGRRLEARLGTGRPPAQCPA
jgi:hypothetical protein